VILKFGMAYEDLAGKNCGNSKNFCGGKIVSSREGYEETYKNG
jgi:hypothetical protein